MNPRAERFALILAGGDGSRLKSLTRKISGHDVPKQFCPVLGELTLLQQTLERIALLIPRENTLASVTRAHSRFYEPQLDCVASANIAVQPSNRGTAAAILYPLMKLAATAAEASVAIFPSDHFVSDDPAFMHYVDSALCATDELPDLIAMLGIRARSPETGYGWIEPGDELAAGGTRLHRVRRFFEKPEREFANELMHAGCLWNSFVMAARVSTIIRTIAMALPGLFVQFSAVRPVLDTMFERETMRRLYNDLPSVNFSEQVLASNPGNLAVITVSDVEWSDLGESDRVMATLAKLKVRPGWAGSAPV
ncbi:MAG TPA: sugar phosphate nucleotidyltransferase [Candidatus Binataceae bacterium]|nr:sugar phosphate nucleotidyltransferase [Candidatus Binataceae bacterium]